MSEGSVSQRKDGKVCAKYEGADGTWKYIYRKTKNEAKKALRQALKDRDEGETPLPSRNAITEGVALENFLHSLEDSVSNRTRECRKYLVRNHLTPKVDEADRVIYLIYVPCTFEGFTRWRTSTAIYLYDFLLLSTSEWCAGLVGLLARLPFWSHPIR